MKKILKPLLLVVSVSMLSGCGVVDMISKQSEKNHNDTMDWLNERTEKNKESNKVDE